HLIIQTTAIPAQSASINLAFLNDGRGIMKSQSKTIGVLVLAVIVCGLLGCAKNPMRNFANSIASTGNPSPAPAPGPGPAPAPNPPPPPTPEPTPGPQPSPSPNPSPEPQPNPSPQPQPNPSPNPGPASGIKGMYYSRIYGGPAPLPGQVITPVDQPV